ncbi:hypothetical protein [Pelobacter seleniigenes]|uniref:hypothetical protein n=1 Tax=Pelobacter seleniigenes TaxID=407188 RepID=UPI0004A7602C|nr:hypothetical protein [Pelobacter seleniigenes]
MFWKKKQNKSLTGHLEKENRRVPSPEQNLLNLSIRRQILDWKDKHSTQVEMHLRRELSTLLNAMDKELDKLSLLEGTFRIKKITNEIIRPMYESWALQESSYLMREAQAELLLIKDVAIEQANNVGDIENPYNGGYILDAFSATTLSVIGLAVIPTVASTAVVSTGGVMGLLGITTVSFPVLLTGLSIIAISVSIGGVRMRGVKKRAIKRYREKLHKLIYETVLSDPDNSKSCLCDQLQNVIFQTCNGIIREITA